MLSETDLSVLRFAARAPRSIGTREDAIRSELGMQPIRYYQHLNRLLDSPDALAATKRLFDGTWHRSPRHTFARERREQLPLLFGPNAARARAANARKAEPEFLPRQRRLVP